MFPVTVIVAPSHVRLELAPKAPLLLYWICVFDPAAVPPLLGAAAPVVLPTLKTAPPLNDNEVIPCQFVPSQNIMFSTADPAGPDCVIGSVGGAGIARNRFDGLRRC
jgi:hypothetical protein